ncbi:hypothetical protein QJS10_CPA07g00149 [Acorus calamus]|uniref:RNase H type-1 domain-containing protein n=1 Tax=Acorus calamus TaxID=4465 RepID=A0AAV9EGY6_ACOCL|nr:hypothetical protein QJS10_CPA07g00149 [Acorus calamus]
MAVEFARDIGLSHIWVCSDSQVIIDALNRGGSGPAQFQSEFERIHACSRPDDPIYFCKVERDHVRAPKVLARTARQIQQTIYTVHLQDDRIRRLIYPYIQTRKLTKDKLVDILTIEEMEWRQRSKAL